MARSTDGGPEGVGANRFAVHGGADGVGIVKLALATFSADDIRRIKILSSELPTDRLETYEVHVKSSGRICHGSGPLNIGPQVCMNYQPFTKNVIMTPGGIPTDGSVEASLDGTRLTIQVQLIMLVNKAIVASGSMMLWDGGELKGQLGMQMQLFNPGQTKTLGGGRIDGGGGVESDFHVTVENTAT